jgi:hypothetical protein
MNCFETLISNINLRPYMKGALRALPSPPAGVLSAGPHSSSPPPAAGILYTSPLRPRRLASVAVAAAAAAPKSTKVGRRNLEPDVEAPDFCA